MPLMMAGSGQRLARLPIVLPVALLMPFTPLIKRLPIAYYSEYRRRVSARQLTKSAVEITILLFAQEFGRI